jgi:carboxypeptidase T
MPYIALKRILLVLAAFVWLLSPGVPPVEARPDEPGNASPVLYAITLSTVDAKARTALAREGLAVEPAGPDSVVAVVDEAALDQLLAHGLRPISVTPLDFPPADSAYHNYAETLEALEQAQDAHPDIVALAVLGQSLQGRAIAAAKISDHPGLDEPAEPALLFMGLHHAREHLTVEMSLEVVRLFTDAYGTDPALTNLVNQREIWVVPIVNPDGGEYDTASGVYQYWRKNRRANGDGTIGVDLNRNYGFGWAGEGASSSPGSETYCGTEAFSEPETQAIRNFALAHPNLTAAISFHSYGEQILYPFGHTVGGIPPEMDETDRAAFVALADRMAETNGYRPGPAFELYSISGDACDWLYAERDAFCFTFELYPPDPIFYPGGAIIERETRRNDDAVTYLAGMADNPRKAAGDGGDATPPTVSLEVTAEQPLAGLPLTLTATAQDDIGVTLVSWRADGETIAMATAAPFHMTWTPSSPGKHVLEALAFDAGGNVGASEPVTVSLKASAYFPSLRR